MLITERDREMFIYTIEDIIRLIVVGFFALLGILWGCAFLVEKVKSRFKGDKS